MKSDGAAAAGVRLLLVLPGIGRTVVPTLTRVPVEGFEANATVAKAWVVRIPNESVSARLSKAPTSRGKQSLQLHNPVDMKKLGIPSSWPYSFHTYGLLVTERENVYNCDSIPVGRHETLSISKKAPFSFLINMATGGGWPVDLSRYHGQADMYWDWVRVYAQHP